MTEEKIFVYKLFLSFNISDFSLFFYVKTAPLPPFEKRSPPLSQQSPLKIMASQQLLTVVTVFVTDEKLRSTIIMTANT